MTLFEQWGEGLWGVGVYAAGHPVIAASHTKVDHDETTVTALVAGGTDGARDSVTCRVTTAAGLTDDRTIHLMIRER